MSHTLTRKPHDAGLRAEFRTAGVLYAVFVVLAVGVLVYRMSTARENSYQADLTGKKASYVATRALKGNHRLRETDFEPPKGIPGAMALSLPDSKRLIGRYLLSGVGKGQAIPVDILSPQPVVHVDSGKTVHVVPLSQQAGALEWLDAGTAVQVLGTSSSFPASVLAICCEKPADRKTCSALIAASPADPCSPKPDDDRSKWWLMPQSASTPNCISWAKPVPTPAPANPARKD